MTDQMLDRIVRDRRTGLIGRVIGVVEWLDQPRSLVVQPPARLDGTVPMSAYVPEAAADIVFQPEEQGPVQ